MEIKDKSAEEKSYEELEPEKFSDGIFNLNVGISLDPDNPMNYYYLAKEYILKVPIRAIKSLKYVEELLRKSLELAPKLWAPKIFLGELLFKQGKYEEAERYLREVIEEKPDSVSAKEYLAECIENNKNKEKISEKDLLYLFENDLRKFIKLILEREFKDNWWRMGVSSKIRANCVARREEGLDEEKDLDPILFANFFDYKEIFQQNKKLFSRHLDVKEWCSGLNELGPIRNGLAHNRDLKGVFDKIKRVHSEFNGILNKAIKE